MYIKKTMPRSNFRSFTSSALTSSEELRVKALPPHLGCRDPVPGFGWIFLLHPPKFLHSWSFLLNRPHFTPLSHLSEQSDPKSLYLTSQAEWHSLQQSSLTQKVSVAMRTNTGWDLTKHTHAFCAGAKTFCVEATRVPRPLQPLGGRNGRDLRQSSWPAEWPWPWRTAASPGLSAREAGKITETRVLNCRVGWWPV